MTASHIGAATQRHLRALNALLGGPQSREALDRIAGCSNAPALVAKLRLRGLTIPCELVRKTDRDGHEVRIGIYSLTSTDAEKVRAWFEGANTHALAASKVCASYASGNPILNL